MLLWGQAQQNTEICYSKYKILTFKLWVIYILGKQILKILLLDIMISIMQCKKKVSVIKLAQGPLSHCYVTCY